MPPESPVPFPPPARSESLPRTFAGGPWRYLEDLQSLCFPPACLLCGRPHQVDRGDRDRSLSTALCGGCAPSVELEPEPACPRCAATVGPHLEHQPRCSRCHDESFGFDRVLRLAPYRTGLKRIVKACKSGHHTALLECLADLWVTRLHDSIRGESIALVTAVPATLWSRWTRWSNHSDVLAERIAWRLRLPCDPMILRKHHGVRKQATLTRSARRANARHAYRADRRVRLDGATILLVDDVVTTGATADACARQLKSIGAGRVIVATIARGLGQRSLTTPTVVDG